MAKKKARKEAAQALQEAKKKGRGGDTDIVHVNPKEKAALKAMGGSGTINPETGLEEYAWYNDYEDFKEAASDVGVGGVLGGLAGGAVGFLAGGPAGASLGASYGAGLGGLGGAAHYAAGDVVQPTEQSEADRILKEESEAREKELYERQVAGYERLEDVYQRAPQLAEQAAQRSQAEVLAAQVGGGLRGGGAAAGARQAAGAAGAQAAAMTQKAQMEAAQAQVEAAAALERMGTPAQRQEASMAEARVEVATVIDKHTDFWGKDEEDIASELLQMAADAVDPKVADFYRKEAKRIEESSWF